MKSLRLPLIALGGLLLLARASAATFYVDVNSANPTPPYADWSTASTDIQSAIDASSDGDLILVNDGIYQTGGETVNGFSLTNRVAINKAVTVQSVNGPAFTVIQGNQPIGSNAVRCVYLTTNAVISGFTLTKGATLNTGDATNEESGGGLFCSINSTATNCIMIANLACNIGGGACGSGPFSGGTLVNCSLIQNQAGVNSGGSSSASSIPLSGGGVFGATLINSLILSNNAGFYGGGACAANLTNCIISQNGSYAGGGTGGITGGGAFDCNLFGCLVVSNAANSDGGVSFGSTATACTIVGNFAYQGVGGFNGSSINDSIIYYNTGQFSYTANYNSSGSMGVLRNCCTTPQVVGTLYNDITNEPAFVDLADGDYHLSSDSPCINSGANSYISFTNDLDGNPRVVAGTVDMGAYEDQTPSSVLSYAWAQQYGFPTDGAADYADPDGDGMNNYQEWKAGTNPTNAASLLNILSVTNGSSGLLVTWQIVSGKYYYLQRSTNLSAQPAFSTIATNLQRPLSSTLPYADTKATNGGPYFYRVGVQLQ